MADVFTLANRVLVWLGEKSHDSSIAMAALGGLGQKLNVNWGHYTMTPATTDPLDAHWSDRNELLPLEDGVVYAIFNLLGRPWFHRLWVRIFDGIFFPS
jgi:hypothetical protein